MIQPQFITLHQLFQGRLFRIPSYQRNYSWRQQQREALFDDITRTSNAGEDRSHFMATVVGLRRETRTIVTTEYQVVEIVDGQQRITTLVLLLKAIAGAVDRSQPEGRKIGQELDETLVKSDDASLLLLQTNHDTSSYFTDYMREGTHPSADSAETVADREILSAIEECEQFVTDWQEESNQIIDLISLLKNRLTFVFHEIGDEALVYTVFEVLNSRGLAVSWFDRLKSMLMGIVFEAQSGNNNEHIDEVHRLWTDIYRCVGLRQGLSTESLRFAATLLRSPIYRPLSEEAAAKLLRDQSAGGPDQVITTTKWLKSVTEAVDSLEADRRKSAVTRIMQARLVATAVHLRKDLDDDTRQKILRHWENVTFRIYGMFRKDARTAVGDYTNLASRIIRKKLAPTEIVGELSRIGSDYPANEAVNELRRSDCYSGWQRELRYFFYRYEEYLTQTTGQDLSEKQWMRIWDARASDSIEHILPQATDSDWIHWLGNLLILPPKLNSTLGAKPPKLKADSYRKTDLLAAREIHYILQSLGKKRWGRNAIRQREETLLQWAIKEWAD